MGLDWNPANKAKDGFEEEFEKVKGKLIKGVLWGQKKLEQRFDEISVPAFQAIEAPIVGKDQEADEWLRDKYETSDSDASFDEVFKGYIGYKVFQLITNCPGIPLYSNGAFGYVEPYSFRAQFLIDCENIIGKQLLEKAYEHHTAGDLIKYGNELLSSANTYAADNAFVIPNEAPEDEKSIESLLHIVKSAAEWAIFWGGKGHGLEPYF
jgi:hypothetical protein